MHYYLQAVATQTYKELWSGADKGVLSISFAGFHKEFIAAAKKQVGHFELADIPGELSSLALTGLKPFRVEKNWRMQSGGEKRWLLDNAKIAAFVLHGIFPHRKQPTVANLLWMQAKLVTRCAQIEEKLRTGNNGSKRHAYAVQIVNLQQEIRFISRLIESMSQRSASH